MMKATVVSLAENTVAFRNQLLLKQISQAALLARAVFLCFELMSVLWDSEICIIQSGI